MSNPFIITCMVLFRMKDRHRNGGLQRLCYFIKLGNSICNHCFRLGMKGIGRNGLQRFCISFASILLWKERRKCRFYIYYRFSSCTWAFKPNCPSTSLISADALAANAICGRWLWYGICLLRTSRHRSIVSSNVLPKAYDLLHLTNVKVFCFFGLAATSGSSFYQ